jgi:hypothetical protein
MSCKALDGVGVLLVNIHELEVWAAQQHEIVGIVFQQRRQYRVSAGPTWCFGYNMRDEAEVGVLIVGDQVTDERLVAARKVTPPTSASPYHASCFGRGHRVYSITTKNRSLFPICFLSRLRITNAWTQWTPRYFVVSHRTPRGAER